MATKHSSLTLPAFNVNARALGTSSTLVIAFCLLQILMWTLAPALVAYAPHHDVIEGYIWGREWVIGTYKHPGLPSWILEASRLATGDTAWSPYLISQIFVAATYLCVFALGCDLMDHRRAAAATLLLPTICFFSWPTSEFNHSVAQMPFWAAFVWAFWRASSSGKTVWWLITAVAAAGGMYAKLSTGIIIATAGGWLLYDRAARSSLATSGCWLALLVFLVLIAPLISWLWKIDLLPLRYIEDQSPARTVDSLSFLGKQVAFYGGLLVVLVWSGLIGRKQIGHPGGTAGPHIAASSQRFATFMMVVPLLATAAIAAILGIRLKPAWGSSMSILSGLLAMIFALIGFLRWSSSASRLLPRSSAAIVPALYIADALYGTRKPYVGQTFNMSRINMPQKAISEHLLRVWQQATDRPFRHRLLWAAPPHCRPCCDRRTRGSPSVLEMDYWMSPWITPERLQADGALVVWSEPGGINPALLHERFVKGRPVTYVAFPWPRAPHKEPLKIGYAILLPQ